MSKSRVRQKAAAPTVRHRGDVQLDLQPVTRFAAAAAVVLALPILIGTQAEGGLRAIEDTILRAYRDPANLADPIGSRFVEILVRDVSALGGVGILVALTALAALGFWLAGKRGSAAVLLATGLSGVAVSETMKALIARGRPTAVPHLVPEVSGSFPSGHAMMSAVIYLMLAVLLTRLVRAQPLRKLIWGLALVLPVLIGLSRNYLGVHWPTDVAYGWFIGALWVLLVAHIANRRGSLQADRS